MRDLWQRLWLWFPISTLLVLGGWHGLMTLRLFGSTPAEIGQGLSDERPLLVGQHALHYAQGMAGAANWRERHSVVGYDPANFSGCPQTPWFASGSRPAEVFAWCGGDRPAAYKIGLALCWNLFPWLVWFGSAILGWGWDLRNLSFLLALLLSASPWGQERLWSGDVALVLATGCLLLTVTLLARFHDTPTWRTVLGLFVATSLTLFWLPFMAVCLAPAVVLFYFCTGSHRPWRWHLALGLALAGAVAVNAPWLMALKEYWWLLGERNLPLSLGKPGRFWLSLTATLTLPLTAKLLFLFLMAGGAFGLMQLRRGKPGSLLALSTAMASAWALAMLGPMWEGCNALEPERFLFVTLVLAILPTAQGLLTVLRLVAQRCTPRWLGWAGFIVAVFLELGFGVHRDVRSFAKEGWRLPQLPLGFSVEQERCLARLRELTTPTARILWEDIAATEHWTPLLSLHTQRSYLGGLGTGGIVEHTRLRWSGGLLAGKPIHEWSATEVTEFCQRHNLGWVVSHSPKGTQFWQQQPLARFVEKLPGGGSLFALQRPHTWILVGHARLTHGDGQRLTLEDLQPEQGRIVLSFHHHDRMQATDHRVRLERAATTEGVLPLLQLRVDAPVARVTIQW